MTTYREREHARRHAPVFRPEELPPIQRRAYLLVEAYLASHPGRSEMQACLALGVAYVAWEIARERLQRYADGVASDEEAFAFDDGPWKGTA